MSRGLNPDHKLPDDEDMRDYLKRRKLRYGKKAYERNKEILLIFEEFCQSYGVDMENISTEDLEDYLDYLLEEGYAHSTIEKSNFLQVGKFLKKKKDIDKDVIESVDRDFIDTTGKIEKNLEDKKKYLEKEEFREMLNHTKNLREELILKLLWETGVRRTEASKIRLSKIDRSEQKIKVKDLKGKEKDERKVYYTSLLSNVLVDWLDNGGREQYQKAESSPYLLPTNQSDRIQPVTINKTVKRVADRAGILEVVTKDSEGKNLHRPTAHSLRHSFAVYRVKNGCPLAYLKDLLGHEDASVTEIYLDYRDEDVKEANRKYRPRF
jgi:integrase/recombinase XerD